MKFPITIRFKLLALAPKLYVSDAAGAEIGFVHQKLLRLKEAVTVYSDESETEVIYKIGADRVIDFNANYHIEAADGRSIGYLRRRGVRSLWRAHYEVYLGDTQVFEIQEQSAVIRLLDGLVGEIPFVGLLTGYFFNPIYDVTREDGSLALQVIKRRSFLETDFGISQMGPLSPAEQECAMLAIMMMVLLERARG